MQLIDLGSTQVEVTKKDIKNIHLSVCPPNGKIKISAPERMELDIIRIYAISKLNWIKKQQTKLNKQDRETPREYVNKESHFFLGKRYLLRVVEQNQPFKVVLRHSTITLRVRPNTSTEKRKELLDEWYREQLKQSIPSVIEKWEKIMKVNVGSFSVRRMKTKWGTCNASTKRILLNLELAKKPKECLEYIVVHEILHLLERHHNDNFKKYMDKLLPQWRYIKNTLNKSPLAHEEWKY